MDVMQKKESDERKLLHDIKVFVGSFIEKGEVSVTKVMFALNGKSKELENIMKRLENY